MLVLQGSVNLDLPGYMGSFGGILRKKRRISIERKKISQKSHWDQKNNVSRETFLESYW